MPGVRKNHEGNMVVTSEVIDVKSSTRSIVKVPFDEAAQGDAFIAIPLVAVL